MLLSIEFSRDVDVNPDAPGSFKFVTVEPASGEVVTYFGSFTGLRYVRSDATREQVAMARIMQAAKAFTEEVV